MRRLIKTYLENCLGLLFPRSIYKREFEQQYFKHFNERSVELAFVFRKLARFCPQKVLDVGSGISALPRLIRNCGCLVTAIDNIKDYWPSETFNRHYHIIDNDITDPKINDKFDLITCISILEHIKESETAVQNMIGLLNPTGYLILTFPYTENEYVRNVYDLPGSSYGQNSVYICQSFSRNELNKWLQGNNCVLVEQEYWQFWSGDYWRMGNRIIPPRKVNSIDKHQISCILIQKKQ